MSDILKPLTFQIEDLEDNECVFPTFDVFEKVILICNFSYWISNSIRAILKRGTTQKYHSYISSLENLSSRTIDFSYVPFDTSCTKVWNPLFHDFAKDYRPYS